jgi:hypothetical protein
MDKIEKGYEYEIGYLREPRTGGFNYRGTTDDFNQAEVGRIVELNYENDAIDNGVLHRAIPNYNSDDYINKYAKEDVKGIYKLEKNNPIWQYTDEDIKQAVLRKLQQQYPIIKDINGLDLTIDRSKGILNYQYDMQVIKSYKKIDVIKAEEDERKGEKDLYFENLSIGETFYIDPQILQSKYPKFANNLQFKKIGNFNRETKWKKTSATTFCSYFEGGKCIQAYISFEDVAKGAEFQFYGVDENYKNWLQYAKQQLGRDIYKGDVCQKIDDTSFKVIQENIVLKTKSAISLQVFFTVFIIEVDEEIPPEGSIPLADVPVGSRFVFTTAAIKKIYWNQYGGIQPSKTVFIKVSNSSFYIWKPGKLDEELFIDMFNEKEKMGVVTEETRKKAEKAQKYAFSIVDGLTPAENNWAGRKISPGSYVIILSEEDFSTKKKSTMDGFLEGLFGKYHVEKDTKGEFIKISPKDLDNELSKVELSTTDFMNLTHEETIDLPSGEYETKEDGTKEPIYKPYRTKIGNSEHFYWVLGVDGNWIINK